MHNFELKITLKDWAYITLIGMLFGFLLSLIFYLLSKPLQEAATVAFSISVALLISLLSSFFITFSNTYILPLANQRFWYIISLSFSFLSGFLGFLIAFFLFKDNGAMVIAMIMPFYLYLGLAIGLLTCLIGLILHQFISMKYKHEESQTTILQTKLDTLESELNPHFLFNALNSITELIYQDQKKAETAVVQLAKLLRSAIDKKGLIDISTEIKMVETYLELENIRFANKIEYTINNYEEFKNDLLPKFSIQLLVENAIKHGFTGEVLQINIYVQHDKILVANNGKITQNVRFGLGLNNLKKRLKLLKIGRLKVQVEDNKMIFSIIRR